MTALYGKRIVVTRPPHKAGGFVEQLKALGAEPILLPMIAIESLEDTRELDSALQKSYDGAVFTSVNTVEQVWKRYKALQIQPRFAKVAAIGTATAKALTERGITPDLIPEKHVAESLFEGMAANWSLRGMKILLPQGDLARPVLENLLQEAGAQVTGVVAYRTVRPDEARGLSPLSKLQTEGLSPLPEFDAITFTSSSTVENFVALFPIEITALVACIGPITAETAVQHGLPVHIIAEHHTVEGLIGALVSAFERKLA